MGTAGAPPIAQNSPQNIGNIPNVVNNIVTTGTTTISNTSNIIGGAIGNVIKYAGLQNNTTGKVTSIQP